MTFYLIKALHIARTGHESWSFVLIVAVAVGIYILYCIFNARGQATALSRTQDIYSCCSSPQVGSVYLISPRVCVYVQGVYCVCAWCVWVSIKFQQLQIWQTISQSGQWQKFATANRLIS